MRLDLITGLHLDLNWFAFVGCPVFFLDITSPSDKRRAAKGAQKCIGEK